MTVIYSRKHLRGMKSATITKHNGDFQLKGADASNLRGIAYSPPVKPMAAPILLYYFQLLGHFLNTVTL